jgi:hypothetical protein
MLRSSFLFTSVAIGLLYLFSLRKIGKWFFAKITIVLVGLLFFFGLLGEVRETANSAFMHYAKPTKAFTNSFVPDEFMWPYIYISSPIANLQLNVERRSNMKVDDFILYSFTPDLISKKTPGYVKPKIDQVVPWLTVGTQYSVAFRNFGWFGMSLVFFSISFLIYVYVILGSNNNPFFFIGILYFTFSGSFWLFYKHVGLFSFKFSINIPIYFKSDKAFN